MRSINNKVLVAIIFSLGLITITSIAFIRHHGYALIEEVAKKKTRDIAKMYFDGVNTMMLTGTMSQRETLRKKYLQDPDILQIKILRGEAVNKLYHQGKASEQAHSAIEKQALKGKAYIATQKKNGQRVITLLYPLAASSNYQGVNCLGCHQVSEGTILGAVRVDYSLKSLDKKVAANLYGLTIINIILIIAGIALLLFLLRVIILKPLKELTSLIEQAEKSNDLSVRYQSRSNDEIGILANAINKMLGRFDKSLQEVVSSSQELNQQIIQINQMSQQTLASIQQQQQETTSITTAIEQMDSNVLLLNNAAKETSDSTQNTNDIAVKGKQHSQQAFDGIKQMISRLQETEQVIIDLNQKTQNITDVLDVIRNLAEQTNLLALNAAIEAARAGESGRGFAVVADEVRNLATRSHESTTEIENIISELQQQAEQAVNYMAESIQESDENNQKISQVAQNMEDIVQQMSNINQHNMQLLDIAHNQQEITRSVSKSMEQINQLSSKSNDNAQQTMQISELIQLLSQKLDALVERFKRS